MRMVLANGATGGVCVHSVLIQRRVRMHKAGDR